VVRDLLSAAADEWLLDDQAEFELLLWLLGIE
jgi:hypothetical protein